AATASVAVGSLVTNADLENVTAQVNTNSSPSDLKITDMRVAEFRAGPGNRLTVRLDTNQGISGYGDVRTRAGKTNALMLKSRIMGMNPCYVTEIFRKIKKHGTWGVQGGGVSAVETACWDLAGKAWSVPVWQMLGGKLRDRVRLYADTPSSPDPEKMGNNLKERMNKGFTFLKMDVSTRALGNVGGGLYSVPESDPQSHERIFNGTIRWGDTSTPKGALYPYGDHPFTSQLITERALDMLEDYCAIVRDIAGWDIPIATDHYGHMPMESMIKFARRLDKFNFAWYEDTVPWYYPDQLLRLKESCTTPICTGEDIYLCEGFKDLFEMKAISVAHPDPAEFGGILESKKLCDLAAANGIAAAFHNANSPVTLIAATHAASAADQFIALEHHGVDDPGFYDLIKWTDLPDTPIFESGFVRVPNGPGLGIELNYDLIKERLTAPGLFEPTPEWDNEFAFDSHQ
ncbi:mandelate racemase/muconate lactonizing enzyme family protein, partial [Candidatus Latescibacterota bacterium]